MENKAKGGLSIFFMSLVFYMMITTKYTHALGDYILEFAGLKSWSGNYSGTHFTIIYFGVLFIISLFLVERYAINNLNISRRKIFLIFIVMVTLFYLLTGKIAINIKKNSPGLSSIGFNLSESEIDYWSDESGIVEFKAKFELTNFSEEEKHFYISMNRELYEREGFNEINFYTLSGEKAIFKIYGNESKSFSVSLNDYIITGGIQNGGEGGIIEEIILTNENGDKAILNKNNDNGFFVELSR